MPYSKNDEMERLRAENDRLVAVIAGLEKTIDHLREQLQQSLEGNTEMRGILVELQNKLDKLLHEKKKRNRKDFGSQTERPNPRPAPSAEAGDTTLPKPRKTPAERNHAKHILSQNVPTEPVSHGVSADKMTCPRCKVETVFVQNQVSYQLEKVLHSIKRLEHQQEVRACKKCKKYVVTAEKPTPPIPGGLPGPCLLASTIVDKCEDGLPQHRQSKIYRREEAIIPRSTLCDWFLAGSLTLEPLYERAKRQLLQSRIIQTDDCPVKIQNRKKRGAMRKGKMTAYRGDATRPIVLFDYSPDLSFDRNKDFLAEYEGIVQADAAGGFDELFKDGSKTEAGCNAHARRRYYELCDQVIAIYTALYKIEKDIRGKPREFRLAARRRYSKPLTKMLRQCINKLKGTLHPTHPLMDAVQYTLKHWIALNRFLGDPDLDIDNNATERAIKTFVLARKNFLFIGSDRGGKAMAINMTFIASCKRLGINPVTYLADVFSRINDMKTSELDQLLPEQWAKQREQAKIS